MGLVGREEENYLHLSEGQKQLCILARTLVSGGGLLLLDEPESALDLRYRSRMLGLLQSWVRQGRRAALVGAARPGPGLNGCDRLVILAEGRVRGVLDRPRTRWTRWSGSLRRCTGRSASAAAGAAPGAASWCC